MQQLKRWPGIELRHLEALAVVVDEGSFRRAARKLGYTQSAISQQIAALERAVGHPVLERPSRGRPLALTEVGARLRRLHDTVEQAMAAARADVAAAAAGVGHVVRVGTPFSFPHLSEAVVAMRVRHPRVVVEVVSAVEDDRLLRLLETGAVDLAVVRSAAVPPPVEVRPAAMCSYAVAIPSAAALARAQKRIALADLADSRGSRLRTGRRSPTTSRLRSLRRTPRWRSAWSAPARERRCSRRLFASAPPTGVTVRPLRDILPPFRLSIATTGPIVPQASDLADLLVAAISGWPNAAAEATGGPASRRHRGAAESDAAPPRSGRHSDRCQSLPVRARSARARPRRRSRARVRA